MMKNMIVLWKMIFTHAFFLAALKVLQAIILCIATPLSIFYIERFINQCISYVSGETEMSHVIEAGIVLGIFMIIIATNGLVSQMIHTRLQRNVENKVSEIIANKYLSLPYSTFENAGAQDVMDRMGRTPQKTLCEAFSRTISVATSIISLFGTALMFSNISPVFPFGFLVFIGIIVCCDYKAMRKMDSVYQEQSTEERKLKYYSELLCDKNSLYSLRVLNAVKFVYRKMDSVLEIVQKERLKVGLLSQKFMLISSLAFKAWIAFILAFMVHALMDRTITVGGFVSLISAIDLMISMIDQISMNITMFSLQYNEVANFYKFLNLTERKSPISEEVAVSSFGQAGMIIEFRNVYFRYPNRREYILQNLSFSIKEGENIALVGANGCGKSTIVKLICGLYEPERGQIFFGSKEIHTITQEERCRYISLVFQDFFKYYLTLRENIGFGDIIRMGDDEKLLEAMCRGNALRILHKSDRGLAMNLGNLYADGIDLSGGEWQKVAISRGNVGDGKIIVMDEPTAALDPTAENEIYTTFVNILKRKEQGSIIISHRLASARIADRIIVIKNGSVFEMGTHEELMKKQDGYYREMFLTQSAWYVGGKKNEGK